MLSLVNISKSFPGRGPVLRDLDLEIKEGESIAITGPSGSGKTTLMNIAGALDRPDTGEVIFRGKSVLTLDNDDSARYRNMNIGFVFQDHLLLPHLTVKENIMLPVLAFKTDPDLFQGKEAYADDLMKKIGRAHV